MTIAPIYPVNIILPFNPNSIETLCETVLDFIRHKALEELTPFDTPLSIKETFRKLDVVGDLIERHPQIGLIDRQGQQDELIIEEVGLDDASLDLNLRAAMVAHKLEVLPYLRITRHH